MGSSGSGRAMIFSMDNCKRCIALSEDLLRSAEYRVELRKIADSANSSLILYYCYLIEGVCITVKEPDFVLCCQYCGLHRPGSSEFSFCGQFVVQYHYCLILLHVLFIMLFTVLLLLKCFNVMALFSVLTDNLCILKLLATIPNTSILRTVSSSYPFCLASGRVAWNCSQIISE